MKRFLLAAALLLLAGSQAFAQTSTLAMARAVTACGGLSLTNGKNYPVTIDLTGALCTGSGGGGSTSVTQGTTPWVVSGQGTAGTAATGVVTVQGIASMTPLLATAQASTNRIGYTSDDPCTQKTKTNAAFTTSSAGPVSIVALSGSTVIYVCSISAIVDTATKLSFIDGTGGSCASAQHAIWGSTTAANGMSLPDNGGFTQGSGNGSVGVTTAASAFCLLQSGTSLVAGNITYVQQ